MKFIGVIGAIHFFNCSLVSLLLYFNYFLQIIFQEYNILNIEPFLSNGLQMELPLIERLNFFRYISAELPNRLLFSVHNRFNVLFNNQGNKSR